MTYFNTKLTSFNQFSQPKNDLQSDGFLDFGGPSNKTNNNNTMMGNNQNSNMQQPNFLDATPFD